MLSQFQIQEPASVNKSQIIKVVIAVILLITAIIIIASSLSGGKKPRGPQTRPLGMHHPTVWSVASCSDRIQSSPHKAALRDGFFDAVPTPTRAG
jgi:hypothetical protein